MAAVVCSKRGMCWAAHGVVTDPRDDPRSQRNPPEDHSLAVPVAVGVMPEASFLARSRIVLTLLCVEYVIGPSTRLRTMDALHLGLRPR